MPVPILTPEQRQQALAAAAASRRAVAAAKEQLRNGQLSLADVLGDPAAPVPDSALKNTKVDAVLRALPGVGQVRAAELLRQAGVAGNRRVAGLGRNQRRALLGQFAA